MATRDDLTSKICQRLDGKVFDMKDYNPGQTAPPFHPHCRSCTCPYFDDEFTEGEMRVARDSETGKTYRVPSNMTYSEWKKSFVKGGSKSGYTSMDLQLFAKNDKKDIKRKIRNGELDGDLFYSKKRSLIRYLKTALKHHWERFIIKATASTILLMDMMRWLTQRRLKELNKL